MKRILTVLAIIVCMMLPASARDKVTTDSSVLPAPARSMLKTYFPKKKVHHIKIDSKVLGGNDYDVVLSDGTEVEFDKNGAWKEVDCGLSAVPSGLVLPAIAKYVTDNFKGKKIVKIEIERNSYEVGLSNGLELKFDRAGNFLKIDD